MRILATGTYNRATRSTDFNATSSRSHAVLQLTFDIESYGDNGQTCVFKSKLSLVDLAGSEKMQDSMLLSEDRTGKHVKELTSINKSLSCLGNVISALSSTTRTHVPYRDSKLTRLLQDSFGGNTRTILIACVAPTVHHATETMNTLNFADRAKNVMLRVKANAVTSDKSLLQRAEAEISKLKLLLKHALEKCEGGLKYGESEMSEEISDLMAQNAKLKKENVAYQEKIVRLEMALARGPTANAVINSNIGDVVGGGFGGYNNLQHQPLQHIAGPSGLPLHPKKKKGSKRAHKFPGLKVGGGMLRRGDHANDPNEQQYQQYQHQQYQYQQYQQQSSASSASSSQLPESQDRPHSRQLTKKDHGDVPQQQQPQQQPQQPQISENDPDDEYGDEGFSDDYEDDFDNEEDGGRKSTQRSNHSSSGAKELRTLSRGNGNTNNDVVRSNSRGRLGSSKSNKRGVVVNTNANANAEDVSGGDIQVLRKRLNKYVSIDYCLLFLSFCLHRC